MCKCPLCGQRYSSESLLSFHLVNWHEARTNRDDPWYPPTYYPTRPVLDETAKAVL